MNHKPLPQRLPAGLWILRRYYVYGSQGPEWTELTEENTVEAPPLVAQGWQTGQKVGTATAHAGYPGAKLT